MLVPALFVFITDNMEREFLAERVDSAPGPVATFRVAEFDDGPEVCGQLQSSEEYLSLGIEEEVHLDFGMLLQMSERSQCLKTG